MAGLTDKQKLFVEAYLGPAQFNATKAAAAAGYKDPEQAGWENRQKQEIAEAIRRRLSEAAMTADEVLARLAEQARGSMEDFLRVDEEEITLTWSLLSVPTDKDGEIDLAGTTMRLAMQEQVQPTDRILHTATITRSVARLDLLEAGRRGKLGLIKKYTLDDKGKVSIELHDAQAALAKLGEHHRLFGGKNINLNLTPDDLKAMSDDDLERLAEQLDKAAR